MTIDSLSRFTFPASWSRLPVQSYMWPQLINHKSFDRCLTEVVTGDGDESCFYEPQSVCPCPAEVLFPLNLEFA